MRQYPVYVESASGRTVAVVTLPDDDPCGVVLTLAGTGRHNLVGSTLCAQLSRRLAVHGLASVRLDYGGTGDSPGLVPEWTLSDVADAATQARAVLAVAREALGVDRFATVGTCYGSRVALGLVGDPGSAGAVCLAPPILDYGGISRLGRRVGERSSLGSFVRSHAALRRLVAPVRRRLRPSRPAPVLHRALACLPGVRLAFLYGPDPSEDHLSRRARELLDGAIAELTPEQKERFEVRKLPWGPLTTFDILSPDEQDEVLDVVVPLVLETLATAPVAARA